MKDISCPSHVLVSRRRVAQIQLVSSLYIRITNAEGHGIYATQWCIYTARHLESPRAEHKLEPYALSVATNNLAFNNPQVFGIIDPVNRFETGTIS
jgi:hypothetical protein